MDAHNVCSAVHYVRRVSVKNDTNQNHAAKVYSPRSAIVNAINVTVPGRHSNDRSAVKADAFIVFINVDTVLRSNAKSASTSSDRVAPTCATKWNNTGHSQIQLSLRMNPYRTLGPLAMIAQVLRHQLRHGGEIDKLKKVQSCLAVGSIKQGGSHFRKTILYAIGSAHRV